VQLAACRHPPVCCLPASRLLCAPICSANRLINSRSRTPGCHCLRCKLSRDQAGRHRWPVRQNSREGVRATTCSLVERVLLLSAQLPWFSWSNPSRSPQARPAPTLPIPQAKRLAEEQAKGGTGAGADAEQAQLKKEFDTLLQKISTQAGSMSTPGCCMPACSCVDCFSSGVKCRGQLLHAPWMQPAACSRHVCPLTPSSVVVFLTLLCFS